MPRKHLPGSCWLLLWVSVEKGKECRGRILISFPKLWHGKMPWKATNVLNSISTREWDDHWVFHWIWVALMTRKMKCLKPKGLHCNVTVKKPLTGNSSCVRHAEIESWAITPCHFPNVIGSSGCPSEVRWGDSLAEDSSMLLFTGCGEFACGKTEK